MNFKHAGVHYRLSLDREVGRAIEDFAPSGRLFVHGEIWNADSDLPVRSEQSVRVVRVDGLRLAVRPEERNV